MSNNPLQPCEIKPREIIDMLMDELVNTGVVPHNMKALAQMSEWVLRMTPTFRPEDPDHWNHTQVMSKYPDELAATRTVTPGREQKWLMFGTPYDLDAQQLFALYRVHMACWKTSCASVCLKWIFEVGMHAYGMLCDKCGAINWQHEKYISIVTKEHLTHLRDVRALYPKMTPVMGEDPRNLWSRAPFRSPEKNDLSALSNLIIAPKY